MGSATSADSLFYDKRPVHKLYITKLFYVISIPVTNAQYEHFDSEYEKYPGEPGFSTRDDRSVDG